MDEVERLTPRSYKLLLKAEEYKKVDRDYRDHLLAYLIFQAQAKKRAGKYGEKPVYSTFKKFYDYEYEIMKLEGKTGDSRFSGISGMGELLKKQQERHKNGGNV